MSRTFIFVGKPAGLAEKNSRIPAFPLFKIYRWYDYIFKDH